MDEPNLQCVPKPRAYKVLLSPSDAAAAAVAASEEDQASGHALRTANLRAAFVAPPGCVLLSGAWVLLQSGWVGAVGIVALPVVTVCEHLHPCLVKQPIASFCKQRCLTHSSFCADPAADYRQIEFRLMAHFSGDDGLCRIFGDSAGADPFVLLAAQWLGIPASQVGEWHGGCCWHLHQTAQHSKCSIVQLMLSCHRCPHASLCHHFLSSFSFTGHPAAAGPRQAADVRPAVRHGCRQAGG